MEERANKTIVCSVFFLDIIGYSKKSVAEQIALKERFNAFLSVAISKVPIEDRIILDTGDGAAVTFLGDVEDALQTALSMRESLLAESGQVNNPLLVRMGINLGPVRLVKDLNGSPNIVGDGINVAQRVMGFADAGQILVSRSYYDAVSRISEEFSGLFHYQGVKTDKHVREHEVYAIGYPGEMTTGVLRPGRGRGAAFFSALLRQMQAFWGSVAGRSNALWQGMRAMFLKASARQRALYTGLMVAPMLLLPVFIGRLSLQSDQAPAGMLDKTATSPAAESAVSAVEVQSAAPVQHHEPVSRQDKGSASSKPAHEQAREVKKPLPADKAATKDKTAKHEEAKPAPAQAEVSLLIKPWGEVYVDDKMQGVSPPLSRLQLPAGKHRITIRNSTFPEFRQELNLEPGEEVHVRHSFK